MALTKEDRIKTVYGGGGQVVILGAGASIATTVRNPEQSKKQLPSMDNLIEIIGLSDILESLPENLRAKNFEQLYNNLHKDNSQSDEIREIEKRVYNYFKDMKLPDDEATIYDYLVLSLRSRDLIATFNWDPFLYQAWNRNSLFTRELPYICFLHGNVAMGYSKEDKRGGPAGMNARRDGGYLEPTKLLFPIEQKNYSQDEFIIGEWKMLKDFLHDENIRRVTIFGYRVPDTDFEAQSLMYNAWGGKERRNMEQFEIIDIRPEDETLKRWRNFIHSHHYDYSTNYFESSLARNPRRTSESYFQHIYFDSVAEAFSSNNPVPANIKTLEELWGWHKPLIEAENEWKLNNPDIEE